MEYCFDHDCFRVLLPSGEYACPRHLVETGHATYTDDTRRRIRLVSQ